MRKAILVALGLAVALTPMASAQNPKAATYITKEEVDTVNKTPGVDRTLRVIDLGYENYSVGIIHRVAPAAGGGAAAGGRGAAAGGGAGGGAARAGGAGGGGGRGALPPPDCGEINPGANTTGGAAGMIAHDSQTEGYLIVSGSGTLITGGHIVNGRKSGPNDEVTTTLNGPSCSGTAVGADVVRKDVKVGDIIIIPAGVPHGWAPLQDHVDYLSFRPSQHVLTAGYVNPAIKK